MRDLREHLRAEAEQTRPAFDEALHARTMQRVSAARRERLVASVSAPRARIAWLSYGGALAAAAVAVALWTFRPAEPESPFASEPELRPLLETLADASLPLRQRLNDPLLEMRQNALLLRDDGERLMTFFVDQLTMVPLAQPTTPPAAPAPTPIQGPPAHGPA